MKLIEPNQIIVSLYGKTVGKLALTPQSVVAFQYDANYRDKGFSISPLKLPLTDEVFLAKSSPYQGNFGVFEDSLPDGWGHLLQDRRLREQGINPMNLNVLQRLALVGKSGRGALEYEPVADNLEIESIPVTDLSEMAQASQQILNSNDIPTSQWENLVRGGGSSGGARPKIFVKYKGKEWLVKFASQIDSQDVGKLEYEYSQLAKECGIEMPETRLFEGKYFGTCRFDREYLPDNHLGKNHIVSAAGLLDADYRIPSLDYKDLLTLTRMLTQDMSQVEQMFRRMVFNVVIGNMDDHAKNFAFMMTVDGEWHLTPAFDILPSTGFNGFHTTTIGGSGRPTDIEMIGVGVEAGLKKKRVVDTIGKIREKVEEAEKSILKK